jgi:hypothetical protein
VEWWDDPADPFSRHFAVYCHGKKEQMVMAHDLFLDATITGGVAFAAKALA